MGSFFTINVIDVAELMVILVGGLVAYTQGYTKLQSKYEDLERRTAKLEGMEMRCPDIYARKDVIGPQLETIKAGLAEIKADVKQIISDFAARGRRRSNTSSGSGGEQ